MLVRTRLRLLDPEEEWRRRRLRARILRRNRIKREIEQGLDPSPHRRGYEPSQDRHEHGGDRPSTFTPTFGGNGDPHPHAQDRYVAGTLRSAYRPVMCAQSPSAASSPSKPSRRHHVQSDVNDPRSAAREDEAHGISSSVQPSLVSATALLSGSTPARVAPLSVASTLPASAPTNQQQPPPRSKAATRWRDAFRRVVFTRHEEILAKDPKRKWRQERFVYLLFEQREYARAAKHLALAITLGATSSTCWRRLAQSHVCVWEAQGDWDALWDAKAAYEQAMNRLEITCNPFALFEYARVLEALGLFTGTLSVCASILQTFPRFQLVQQVTLRFVLLQRYQLFSSPPPSAVSATEAIEKEAMLLKCIGYTKVMLLDRQITDGDKYVCVLYMHARLNELLAVSTTSAGGGDAAAKAAQQSSDHSFDELFRVASARHLVPQTAARTLTWSAWRAQSASYIALAGHFHDQSEPIAAADALSRALDLLDAPLARAASDSSVETPEQRQCKLALYLALGRNFYQCNQMERAIRSMEAVFEMNVYHAEARASLAAWFPAKWKYRLDLEDASQTQIARVIRGIWGRNAALGQRQHALAALERKYRENPYHPLHRRNVARISGLRTKYAPLFLAQDLSARRIQATARRFLYYARIRWSLAEQRAKFIQQLTSKQQTRKYRYNRHVRQQLAQLVPDPFETQFEREDHAALLIQRCFRGERVRRGFRVRRNAHRSTVRREHAAAQCLQRFLRRYCCAHEESVTLSPSELFSRAQRRVAQAKARVAWNLQQLYRRRWHSSDSASTLPSALFRASLNAERQQLQRRDASATTIQRAWRRWLARRDLGAHAAGDSAKVLVQQLKRGHERQQEQEPTPDTSDLDLAARKIQALYRGKRIHRSLSKIRRVLAPPSPSPIAALIERCETNRRQGLESCVTLQRVQSVSEKRALFDNAAVVLNLCSPVPAHAGDAKSAAAPPFSLQSAVSAVEHSAVLRCLVVPSGNLCDGRIASLLSALKSSRSLRVLALGSISTDLDAGENKDSIHGPKERQHRRSLAPEQDEEGGGDDDGECEQLAEAPVPQLSPLQRMPRAQVRSDTVAQEQQQRPMQLLSLALRTANFVLEELYLEDNALAQAPADGACVAAFLGDFFFARYGRLATLALVRMRFSDANAARLGAALALNTTLTHLDLSGNLIGDSGSAAIAARGLVHNESLAYLSLADNCVGSVGATALFTCLTHSNHTLETLVLSNNNVRNDAIPALACVDLRGNLIHSDHLETLQQAMDERRQSSAAEPELRLFLARKRFALDSPAALTQSATRRVRSPLKSVLSSKATGRGKRPAKLALSPNAFLKQARQSTDALVSPVLIHSPLAVYREQQSQYACSTNGHAPSAAVLALVSPVAIVGRHKPKAAGQSPSGVAAKLPLISSGRASASRITCDARALG